MNGDPFVQELYEHLTFAQNNQSFKLNFYRVCWSNTWVYRYTSTPSSYVSRSASVLRQVHSIHAENEPCQREHHEAKLSRAMAISVQR